MTRVVLTHATGNENVRQALAALAEHGMLERFWTAIGWPSPPSSIARRLVPPPLLATRTFAAVPAERFELVPMREIIRNLALRAPSAALRRASAYDGPIGAAWVYRGFDAEVARRSARQPAPDVLYSYSNLAELSFRAAQSRGVTCVLEVAHVRFTESKAIVNAARQRSGLAPVHITAGESAYLEQTDREIDLADVVVSPSSQVTASVLRYRPNARVIQLPYGCPDVENNEIPRRRFPGERLRILYVGRLDPSKGVRDLAVIAEAAANLIDLHIVGGTPDGKDPDVGRLLAHATHHGPMPRMEVLRMMREHHALLNVSLVEGRSLAALEALSTGLPVLATAGSGVEDLVVQGCGTLLPTGDPAGVVELLRDLADDSARIETMSTRALEVARTNSWRQFRDGLAELLAGLRV